VYRGRQSFRGDGGFDDRPAPQRYGGGKHGGEGIYPGYAGFDDGPEPQRSHEREEPSTGRKKLRTMIDVGFSEEESALALALYDGDLRRACEYLFNKQRDEHRPPPENKSPYSGGREETNPFPPSPPKNRHIQS